MRSEHTAAGGRDPGGPRPSALIVNDEGTVRAMVAELLSGAGFDCVEASDAEEALGLLEGRDDASAFGIGILDLALPGISGAQLAWQIREKKPELPLVALSGKLEVWDADDLADLGFVRVFAKPMDCDEFVSYCTRVATGGAPGTH